MWVAASYYNGQNQSKLKGQVSGQPDKQKGALSELPSSIVIEDRPMPSCPIGGILVKLRGASICGSDLDKWRHGKFNPGGVLGHEVVGEILERSASAPSHLQVGNRVVAAHHVPCLTCHYCINGSESMCRQFKATNFDPGGFAEVIALSEGHCEHVVFPVPETVSDFEATCVEPLGCVLKAIDRGTAFKNGTVAVVGLGFIGLMAGQVYKQQGYTVLGLDIQPERLRLAEEIQAATLTAISSEATALPLLSKHNALGQVDTVFLSVVNPATVELGLKLVREGGEIILFASGPEGTGIDPSRLYFREVTVIPSYSPSLASLTQAKDMIFTGQIQVTPLQTHTFPMADIEAGARCYQAGEAIKVFLTP